MAEVAEALKADLIAAVAPAEKKLWGTPLKLKQANERIAELELQVSEYKALAGIAPQDSVRIYHPAPSEYDFEVWQRTQDTKTEKKGDPCRWRHWHSDGKEWVYHEKLSLWSDSGYGEFLQERAAAMIGNAFGGMKRPDGSGTVNQKVKLERFGPLTNKGDQTYEKFPEFSQENIVEVIVRVRKP